MCVLQCKAVDVNMFYLYFVSIWVKRTLRYHLTDCKPLPCIILYIFVPLQKFLWDLLYVVKVTYFHSHFTCHTNTQPQITDLCGSCGIRYSRESLCVWKMNIYIKKCQYLAVFLSAAVIKAPTLFCNHRQCLSFRLVALPPLLQTTHVT